MKAIARSLYRKFLLPKIEQLFFTELVRRSKNFGDVHWLGYPVWQNVLDLWTIQEVISEVRPALLIECGTNRGGSARFYAHLFDLMGRGEVVTVDVETMHDLEHPRVTFLVGSSTSADIVEQVQERADAADGPVLVILDSDHSETHVYEELRLYSPFVTPGSYCLVQDGVIDTLPVFRKGRPGPLPAIERFLSESDEFLLREDLCSRFLISHHPKGWLQRKS